MKKNFKFLAAALLGMALMFPAAASSVKASANQQVRTHKVSPKNHKSVRLINRHSVKTVTHKKNVKKVRHHKKTVKAGRKNTRKIRHKKNVKLNRKVNLKKVNRKRRLTRKQLLRRHEYRIYKRDVHQFYVRNRAFETRYGYTKKSKAYQAGMRDALANDWSRRLMHNRQYSKAYEFTMGQMDAEAGFHDNPRRLHDYYQSLVKNGPATAPALEQIKWEYTIGTL